uniref:Uncharacterized protein n=1 Tax=Anguilla anguilla TaxID=7936 RepID=A0A0E9TTL6_ANGAN
MLNWLSPDAGTASGK